MKALLTGAFFLLALLASPTIAKAGVWPFGKVYKTKVNHKVVATRHEWRVLRRVNRYGGGCLQKYMGKRWAWKTKAGKWTLYDTKGKRLSPYQYYSIDDDGNGVVLGKRAAGRSDIAERIYSTGKIVPAL